MRFRSILLKTLSALALGVFFSCGPNAPDPLYPQDRSVKALIMPNLDPAVEDSIKQGIYPPARSGWVLHWSRPMNAEGANDVFIFGDSIPKSSQSLLINGTGPLDPKGLPLILVQLPATDSIWEIPSQIFGDAQGRGVRTDTAYRFSVWVRYASGDAGGPVTWRQFLGDEMRPIPPVIRDSIGQTKVVLRFGRPLDQTSKFDTLLHGPIASIQVRWWPGFLASDSVVESGRDKDNKPILVNQVRSASVPLSELRDLAQDSFRLELGPLRYFTSYSYRLIVKDSVGLTSSTSSRLVTTRDSLPPSAVKELKSTLAGTNTLVLSWGAATDAPAAVADLPGSFNYRISQYLVRLDGVAVDSLNLPGSSAGMTAFMADSTWPSTGTNSRFRWSGSLWTWTWPNLRPGKSFSVSVSVRDSSGNDALTSPSATGTAPSAASFACPNGFVPVGGTATIRGFCIEEREHRNGSAVQKLISWQKAIDICSAQGAFLCSDSQWVRACEILPDAPSSAPNTFGSIETGRFSDTASWLASVCALGTGDSSWLRDTTPDPRCVSGWGVFDLPGGVAEWTRDVFHTAPGPTGQRDSTLAWIDTSDLTGKPNVGTIHGGSWLRLDQANFTVPSSRCRERNYPAFANLYDSLPNASVRRRANPEGVSKGVGFRCCRMPGN